MLKPKQWRNSRKRLILVCAAVGSFITARAATDDSVFCRRIDAQVALTPGTPASYTVSGELCATEDELSTGGTVQLLIHGAGYNHTYWDFGTVNGIQYSYARDVAAHGFPTFALDLIGAGNSSHPPSNQVTNEVTAYVAHQIVQGLRSGSVNGSPLGLRCEHAGSDKWRDGLVHVIISAGSGRLWLSVKNCCESNMTALELYRRLLDLLRESGLSKQEKIEILERASSFVKEEAAVEAIWEPRVPKSRRTKGSS